MKEGGMTLTCYWCGGVAERRLLDSDRSTPICFCCVINSYNRDGRYPGVLLHLPSYAKDFEAWRRAMVA